VSKLVLSIAGFLFTAVAIIILINGIINGNLNWIAVIILAAIGLGTIYSLKGS
jgi:hypothetical protein